LLCLGLFPNGLSALPSWPLDENLGCEELNQAILAGIIRDEIPCGTTKVLFKRFKEEIIRLKDEGRVLMRFNELRESLKLRYSGEFNPFADEELRAVLTLVAGPGVVWELAVGSWVLLQPERIKAYAHAVIRTLHADEHQRGCLMEERVLKGDLASGFGKSTWNRQLREIREKQGTGARNPGSGNSWESGCLHSSFFRVFGVFRGFSFGQDLRQAGGAPALPCDVSQRGPLDVGGECQATHREGCYLVRGTGYSGTPTHPSAFDLGEY